MKIPGYGDSTNLHRYLYYCNTSNTSLCAYLIFKLWVGAYLRVGAYIIGWIIQVIHKSKI